MTLHVHFTDPIDPARAHRFAALLQRHQGNLDEGAYVRDPAGALWRVREVRRVTALSDDLAADAAEGTWSEESHPRDKKGKFAKKGQGKSSYVAELKKHGYEPHPDFPGSEIYHHPSGHHIGLYPPSPSEAAKGQAGNWLKHLPPGGAKPSIIKSKGQLSALLTGLHAPKSQEKPVAGLHHPAAAMQNLMTESGFKPYAAGGVPSDTSVLYENKNTKIDVIIDKEEGPGHKYSWTMSGGGTPAKYGTGAYELSQALLEQKEGSTKKKPTHPDAAVQKVLESVGATPIDNPDKNSSSKVYEIPGGFHVWLADNENPNYGIKKNGEWKGSGSKYGAEELKSELSGHGIPFNGKIDPSVAEPIEENVQPPAWADVSSKTEHAQATIFKMKTGETVLTDHPTGKWYVNNADGETVKEGTGQESLNAAFEALHPRGEGGKFVVKPTGNSPMPSDSDFEELDKWVKSIGWESKGGGIGGDYKGPNGENLYITKTAQWVYEPYPGSDEVNGSGIGNLADLVESGKTNEKKTSAPAVGPALQMSSLTKIGAQKGSNPGGVYKAEDGTTYYVKQPQTSDHAKNEILAGALYRLAGANTLDYHPVENGNNPLGVATKMIHLDEDNVSGLTASKRAEAQKDFAIHAWLANWDAVGLSGDNVGLADGKVMNLDLGGSLLYRAKGGAKGAAFGNDPTEWTTLRDSYKNPQSAALFKDMTPQQLKESASRLKGITNQDINKLVNEHGPGDAVAQDKLSEKLIARRDAIIKLGEAEGANPSAAEPKTLSPAEQQLKDYPTATYSDLDSHAAEMTTSESLAIQSYKGSGYHEVNDCLRIMVDCEHVPQVGTIREWLHGASIPKNVTLYRGVGGDYGMKLQNVIQYAKNKGKPAIIEDPGFLSLTTSRSTAEYFGPVRFNIAVKAGSKGSGVHNPNESELLFQQRTRLIVTGEKDSNGYYLAVLDQSHMIDTAEQAAKES